MLAGWLETARRTLGADDPFVKAALQGRPARDVAHEAIAGTRLLDLAARKALARRRRRGDSRARPIRCSRWPAASSRSCATSCDWRDNRIRSVEAAAGQQIASARFAVYGRSVYPDANFTLRLGYGRALGYEEDTTLVPWKTTFFGLFDRAEGFGGKPPYDLAERWRNGRDRAELVHAAQLRLHGRHDRRQFRQPGRQPAAARSSGSISTATSRSSEPLRVHRRGRRQPRHRRPQRRDHRIADEAVRRATQPGRGTAGGPTSLPPPRRQLVAGVGRAEPQLHDQQRPAPRGLVARGRTAGRVEPAARQRPLGHPRRRGPPLHDVPGRRADAADRGTRKRSSSRWTRPPARRCGSTSIRRASPTSAAAPARTRRRSSSATGFSRRHQPSIPRIRQAHRQSAVVARSRRRVRRPAAAHPAGREVGPWRAARSPTRTR